MLKRLGFTKFAYDWRESHVPDFEDEIQALKNAGIRYLAFWNTHDSILKLFTQYQLSPQIWWYSQSPSGSQQQRIEQAAKDLVPIVKAAGEIGSTVGLYNHLDWGGEPENMVAVVRRVREYYKLSNIGIVYNFHHGHGHIQDFASALALMKPYLLCVNLNGMNDNAEPKILTLGKGKHERTMIQQLRESGFRGSIGIIAHQETRDAEVVLRENLEG
ncbi:MAG: heme-binding domain-containing protein, partial [Deltaproteobacteria bacterium]